LIGVERQEVETGAIHSIDFVIRLFQECSQDTKLGPPIEFVEVDGSHAGIIARERGVEDVQHLLCYYLPKQ